MLSQQLKLNTEPINNIIYDINSQVLIDSYNSSNVELTSQFIPYFILIVVEVLIILLNIYDIILDIP